MSSSVAKASSGEVSEPLDQTVEEYSEQKSSAQASAGLNLNLAGAVSGLFSSSSKKEIGEDGSSVETKTEKAKVNGAGAGNLNAAAAGSAHDKKIHAKQIG